MLPPSFSCPCRATSTLRDSPHDDLEHATLGTPYGCEGALPAPGQSVSWVWFPFTQSRKTTNTRRHPRGLGHFTSGHLIPLGRGGFEATLEHTAKTPGSVLFSRRRATERNWEPNSLMTCYRKGHTSIPRKSKPSPLHDRRGSDGKGPASMITPPHTWSTLQHRSVQEPTSIMATGRHSSAKDT